ncbi:MAG: ABC transporter ATP-binding protein/permease [Clostridiales bacterium]|jgi:ATP-binding cassette subfamily B protein|nr:ABC transporter ATP-binding protein/permease [Clostridiales bacterium]
MLKSFIKYYKPHRKLFVIDLFFALMVALCNLFYPSITKSIISDYAPNKRLAPLLVWCGALLLIYILKALLNYFIQHQGHVLGVRIQGDMRRDMFRHIQKLPFSYFDSNKTGALMSRMVNDLQDIAELAHHGPEDLFLSLITMSGAFIMLSFINIPLTLTVFAILPIAGIFAAKSRINMKRSFRKMREETARINAEIETSISGIRITRAYSGELYEQEKFDGVNEDFKRARGNAYKAIGIFSSGMGLVGDMMYLAVLAAGGLFLFFEKINPGEFAAYILYVVILINPVKTLVGIFEQIQSGMTGYMRFREVMSELPEEENKTAEIITDITGNLVFDNVKFGYVKEKEILKGLSFSAENGKTTALVGESGSGKTTVCHLLMRFYDIYDGKIMLGAKSINEITRASLRSNIGLVAQDVFIFDGTIRENIAYGRLDATDEEIQDSAKRARIHEFIISLPDGYDSVTGERGIRLSGGQRQRISIARAFLKNPRVLILDEATSALDNTTEAEIQSALEELSSGRTTIVVAHRLSTVRNADKIIVLKNGIAAEEGTHDELIKKGGLYSRMYAVQKKSADNIDG